MIEVEIGEGSEVSELGRERAFEAVIIAERKLTEGGESADF